MALAAVLKRTALPTTGRLRFVAADLAAGTYTGLRELKTGWLLCNGAAVTNVAPYQALYAQLGTKFGAAGTLPNFVDGKVPVPRGSSFAIGVVGGEINHVLTLAEMASHYHIYADNGSDNNNGGWDIDPWQPDHALSGDYTSSSSAGGGGAHNNMPPYLVVGCVLVRY